MERLEYGLATARGIWNWLANLPPTFWSVVLGASIALGGVIVTNRSHDRRLARQLEHDRDMKKSERDLALRKDVFLAAAEAVSEGIQGLSSCANLQLPDDQITVAYKTKSAAIAKVHVIGTMPTIHAILKMGEELTVSYFKLMAIRISPKSAQTEVVAFQKLIDAQQDDIDRTLELMKQYNLAGKHNPREWDVLQSQMDFAVKQKQKLSTSQTAFRAKMQMGQIELAFQTAEQVSRVSTFLPQLVAGVRAELGIDFDAEAYTTAMMSQAKRSQQLLLDFVERVKREAQVTGEGG